MQVHGISHAQVPAIAGQTTDLPVIAGLPWFETEGKPFALRMAFPLSFDEMVAALYLVGGHILEIDLATAEDICGQIALALTFRGLFAIEQTVEYIKQARVEDPTWLAFCRERVTAAVTEIDRARQDAA